jgi:hypothetical protein
VNPCTRRSDDHDLPSEHRAREARTFRIMSAGRDSGRPACGKYGRVASRDDTSLDGVARRHTEVGA